MRRMAVTGFLLVLVGTGAAGCTSSNTASSSAATGSSSSGLCDAMASLKQSAGKLQDMQLSENGVAAMRDQLAVVKTDLTQVVDEAKAGYADAAAALQKDVDAVRSAASGVKGDASKNSVDAVRVPLDTLKADLTSLYGRVSAGCS